MKYHLRLKKALSYTGAICATRKEPDAYTEDKKVAEAAVASGYFELVESIPNPEAETPDEITVKGHLDFDQLMSMTKDELKDLAAKLGVDTTGFKVKEDYAKAISAVEVEAPADEITTEADFTEE